MTFRCPHCNHELTVEDLKFADKRQKNLPSHWRVGDIVRFVRFKDWAWDKGAYGIINAISDQYSTPADPFISVHPADAYQVFYTHIYDINTHTPLKHGTFWTTPEDVEYIGANQKFYDEVKTKHDKNS